MFSHFLQSTSPRNGGIDDLNCTSRTRHYNTFSSEKGNYLDRVFLGPEKSVVEAAFTARTRCSSGQKSKAPTMSHYPEGHFADA